MKETKKVELLAPAGNKEAFYGAIHAGADAVYLGGNRFGARAYADNFTEEELISCIRYAHLFGRKVYLTVNTLVKEVEFPELYSYLLPFYEAGLDGVIVQDIGVFAYIREVFPKMELHVSTQMTITGKYGAKLLKEMGACRVVPARELSLAEIRELKEATGLEIETFIHGAMCYCYSGQCLFSSILGGRSGNRGRCAQPCRLPYRVQNGKHATEECYPLSLKDMCTIEHISELIEAGIDSFKIEGRMKKAEYAAGVTSIYRKYIDKYYKNPGRPVKVSSEDMKILSGLYIRSERQDGYYYKHNGKEMVTLSQPSYSGCDEQILEKIRNEYLEKRPRLPITVYADFRTGEAATVTFLLEDISVTVTGDVVQPAQRQPVTRENIAKQLGKVGDSVFSVAQMEISVDDTAFYPLKAMNELRRNAIFQLENALIAQYGLPVSREAVPPVQKEQESVLITSEACERDKVEKGISVSVQSLEQLAAICEKAEAYPVSMVYVDGDLLVQEEEVVLQYMAKCDKWEYIIALPYVLRAKDASYLQKIYSLWQSHGDKLAGFQVRNPEGMGYLKAVGYKGKIYTDAGFYIWNRKTLQEWSGDVCGHCLPYELKSNEQRAICTNANCEKIFYGRIPMMITANCVVRTTDNCCKGTKQNQVQLIDRYQKQFPVRLNCLHCMNIIYNSVPLSLHSQWQKWQESVTMRLDFSIENASETAEILAYFAKVYAHDADKVQLPFKEYTTGHEKRGVE